MKNQLFKPSNIHFIIFFWCFFFNLKPLYAIDLSIADTPLYIANVKPNVMVMLDNSGSMKLKLKTGSYNNSKSYYGLFESNQSYIYNTNIPINTAAYSPVNVAAGSTGAFVANNCTPAAGNTTCWNGNFLNWLTTKRIDGSRKVLIGGKLESRTAFNYGTNLNYKIVANNETADRTFNESQGNTDNYSPIANNTPITVISPAAKSGGARLNSYDPYAKIISTEGDNLIYTSSGNAIGEFGNVSINAAKVNGAKQLKAQSWTTVTFNGSYTNTPIVVAKPSSYKGSDPSIIRIKDVSTTGFKISMQEWFYKDGNHAAETASYVVMKKGTHVVAGGRKFRAGSKNTSRTYINGNCGSSLTQSENINLNTTFASKPVVIASVMTYNDTKPVNARVWNIGTSSFRLALQEEEDEGSHGNETIAYIATTTGTINDVAHKWTAQTALVSNVNKNSKTITFNNAFAIAPSFIAATQSKNENDSLSLRLTSISNTTAKLFVQEEKSCDNEVNHNNEDVGYMAFLGSIKVYNIALVVKDEPIGLLQDIKDKVRIGVSYYRYLPNSGDIYNGEKSDGGTIKFKIPKNPFVKKPTDSGLPNDQKGYRELTGYIGSSIEDVVDSLEHYPLVWGTTPLAENLWEVFQYFEQDTPHYPDVLAGFKDFDVANNAHPERDPFYYPNFSTKLECAKSSVIIFTDGEPYRDANVPASVQDFDGDSHGNDIVSTDPNDHGQDNLDDVACWGYSSTAGSSCSSITKGTRDLRPLLDGDQSIKVYTVAFGGGNTPSQILQDTAANAGGQSYAAEDGYALKTALESAFTAALADSSSSAVSINSGNLNSESAVFQARFDSEDWSGELLVASINPINGNLSSPVNASKIPTADDRIILTHNGSSGIAFRWPANPGSPSASELTIAQQALLGNSSSVLNYIRGNSSNEEKNGGGFRNRTVDAGSVSSLGDLINSAPFFVANEPAFVFSDTGWAQGVSGGGAAHLEDTYKYSAFRTTIKALNGNKGRTPIIYIGSNDGMLHAFNATTGEANSGKEIFAYIPSKAIDKLLDLSAPNYAHKYSVDGSPIAGDVLYDNAWHSVLVSSLGAGGQGLFALDITQPDTYYTNESVGAAKVLWEFTDKDDDNDHSDGNIGEKGDKDLGFGLGKPAIARMANGDWVAIFGNGYNNMKNDGTHKSSTGNAVLYIVNIKTGVLIKKIDTGIGYSAAAATGDYNDKPNGLSAINPIDDDSDNVVDAIYAGDLYGNIWKFNVDDKNPNNWGVAFSGVPLFTACASSTCNATNRLPITTQPQVKFHPSKKGKMIYFGTGQYFETGDNTQLSQNTQTFYGVWDKEDDWTAFNRFHLLQQEIAEVTDSFDTDGDSVDDETYTLRATTNNSISWYSGNSLPVDGADAGSAVDTHLGWYINLINTAGGNTNNYGERQVTESTLHNNKIIFTTLIPSEEPCDSGGTGWLMELESADGSRPEESPFDLNEDGDFDTSDWIDDPWSNDPNDKIPPSSPPLVPGIPTKPGIMPGGDGKEYKYISNSSGTVKKVVENPGIKAIGRQSWKQLSF